LGAVSDIAGRDGLASLTVERVLEVSGASRASFYQYFANIDDCFWSAYRLHAEELVGCIAASASRAEHPELAMLDALIDLATARPGVARLLMRESLASGAAGRSERDALIRRIVGATGARDSSRTMLDIPPAMLLGGIFRFLSMRLEGTPVADELRAEVRAWACRFVRHSSASWSARLLPDLRGTQASTRHRSPSVPRSQSTRVRILRATAAMVRKRGYRAFTVADVVAEAGVSRRLFYHEFASKADAFIAAYNHMYERTVAACAPAFFGAGTWPERVWECSLAFAASLAQEPTFAYLGFVECYAIGDDFVARVHDTQLAFSLFLEEGYRQRPADERLPRGCLTLTVAVIFESGFQACRSGPHLFLRRIQPLAVYLALAPFIGADAAGAFVSGKLAPGWSPGRRRITTHPQLNGCRC
jgi:AcrR family transcriptional regulator